MAQALDLFEKMLPLSQKCKIISNLKFWHLADLQLLNPKQTMGGRNQEAAYSEDEQSLT